MSKAPDGTVRVMFPLLLTKRGEFCKKQKLIRLGMNGSIVVIARGKAVDMPAEFLAVCAHIVNRGSPYECFISIVKENVKAVAS